MTTEFERELPPFRLVETHQGDDLPAIAYRELGDANRWVELVWINRLSYPYITDDIDQAAEGVLLAGSLIRVPSPAGFTEDKSSTEDVYERDVRLVGRLLVDDGKGDFQVVGGVDNLTQQLAHALDTPRGQLIRHPSYGCMVWRILGLKNGPLATTLGAEYVKSTLLADYRVSNVSTAAAEVMGDSVKITAIAEALAGGTIQIRAGS